MTPKFPSQSEQKSQSQKELDFKFSGKFCVQYGNFKGHFESPVLVRGRDAGN